jgi:hypothetical protein
MNVWCVEVTVEVPPLLLAVLVFQIGDASECLLQCQRPRPLPLGARPLPLDARHASTTVELFFFLSFFRCSGLFSNVFVGVSGCSTSSNVTRVHTHRAPVGCSFTIWSLLHFLEKRHAYSPHFRIGVCSCIALPPLL